MPATNRWTTTSTTGQQSTDTFADLVAKVFATHFVLFVTERGQQWSRRRFDDTVESVLNHFGSVVQKLNLTIRDLYGHNAYPLHSLRFKFNDWQTLKSRPKPEQLRKLQMDLIGHMSPTVAADSDSSAATVGGGQTTTTTTTTPWYDRWKQLFIDTIDQSEHDFIGANFGVFFVITDEELDNFKDLFATFITQLKQMSWIRWIQPDFVRYYIVLSEQSLDTHQSFNSPKALLFRELQSIYPNSYWLHIDSQLLSPPAASSSMGGDNGIIAAADDEVFCDNNNSHHQQQQQQQLPPMMNRYDSSENCNHLSSSRTDSPIGGTSSSSVDPLNATVLSLRHTNSNNQTTLSSGSSDQSLTNSIQSLSLQDLSQRYLQMLIKPTAAGTGRSMANNRYSPAVATIISDMLKEFVTKTLVPWSEKHIKLLGDAIAQRKGFRKSMFNLTKSMIGAMSSSTIGSPGKSGSSSSLASGGSGSAGSSPPLIIYSPEAPEMQQRKLGDLAMSLTMYELAYQSYYQAKKDYQAENAVLYYAGATEASAIASYFTQRFQKHYFEQSITCYADSCGLPAMPYATRATILATEALRQQWPNEAAKLFIHMTGDDSELRSALFLEQASLCFLAAGSRQRKAAFHYVLAGHRFNKCYLKHYALAAYRQYPTSQWTDASDFVSLTVGRLYLNIYNTNPALYGHYRRSGLELFRINARKEPFFHEFIREIKKDFELIADNNSMAKTTSSSAAAASSAADSIHYLDIPFIHSVGYEPTNNSVVTKKDRNLCFLGEEIVFRLCLTTPFAYVLHRLCFYTTGTNTNSATAVADVTAAVIDCPAITTTLDTNDPIWIQLSIKANTECEFDILGVDYKCDDIVDIRCPFSDKQRAGLRFRAIKTLPLIHMELRFKNESLEQWSASPSLPVYTNEIIELLLKLSIGETSAAATIWRPSSVRLTTNAILLNSDNNNSSVITNARTQTMAIVFDGDHSETMFKIQMPSTSSDRYDVQFTVTYRDNSGNQSRSVCRTLSFSVSECLRLDSCVQEVLSLTNTLPTTAITVIPFPEPGGQQPQPQQQQHQALSTTVVNIELPPQLTGHVLTNGRSLAWSIGGGQQREGLIRIQ
ncbi:trafficking protein particle complex subunit 8-like [Oppia nitens]|uniref:trafficking protein particle complex subunit 8-like n=1 Tax=Oppia nitens TaxID=1686743 RepID=UPI0023DC11BE|nr:trafficking protein particle complex subunit 8-like [Oppia nitens]